MIAPLTNIRVLDLTRLLPGAVCSLMLADQGADVIKVEQPGAGDYMRWYVPRVGDYAATFHALNRNKRSLTLDLKQAQGLAVLNKLVQSADVLLENFRPQVAERLGVTYAALKAVNPRLIVCSLSGFGQSGVMANVAGHDLNFVGLSGILNAGEGNHPMPIQAMDFGSAYLGAFAISTALYQRERTGEGAYIDVALLDAGISLMTMARAEAFARGSAPQPAGELLSGGYACYDVYCTADGKRITLAALEDKFWSGFCKAAGRADLAGKMYLDPDLQPELRAEVTAIFASKTYDEWLPLLAQIDACMMPALDLMTAADHPQMQARDSLYMADGVAHTRTPFQMGERVPHRPAPDLGADTDRLLSEAGYSAAEIQGLRENNVI